MRNRIRWGAGRPGPVVGLSVYWRSVVRRVENAGRVSEHASAAADACDEVAAVMRKWGVRLSADENPYGPGFSGWASRLEGLRRELQGEDPEPRLRLVP